MPGGGVTTHAIGWLGEPSISRPRRPGSRLGSSPIKIARDRFLIRPFVVPDFYRSLLLFAWAAFATAGVAQDAVTSNAVISDAETSEPKASSESAKVDQGDQADRDDPMRGIQSDGVKGGVSEVISWGTDPDKFTTWGQHSNRLIPVYTYGITLDSWRTQPSPYTDGDALRRLYGTLPADTLTPAATHYDQTQIYDLQQTAIASGKRRIIVMVFDGMDWQTTRAAAAFARGQQAPSTGGPSAPSTGGPSATSTGGSVYSSGRGSGLSFLDYRDVVNDFGLVVTSPLSRGARFDVDAQTIERLSESSGGGYSIRTGGEQPWGENSRSNYLIGENDGLPHAVTDSASSATSLFTGRKTYNGAISVGADGEHFEPIARTLQSQGWRVGLVTSVPISHATPAAAYANNVTRKDYQDIARDLIGLPSSSHPKGTLPGADVVIGGGAGEGSGGDSSQGENFKSGNPYVHQDDVRAIDVQRGGRYVVARRTKGSKGTEVLSSAVEKAVKQNAKLFGLFGTRGGHFPFRTADGRFNPTFDGRGTERYTDADLNENVTLADATDAALAVLGANDQPFWLLIEAGDVDWANHANNIDNSIGAVISGGEAFARVTAWIDAQDAWQDTAVIVTADHGHFLVIKDADAIHQAGMDTAASPTSK